MPAETCKPISLSLKLWQILPICVLLILVQACQLAGSTNISPSSQPGVTAIQLVPGSPSPSLPAITQPAPLTPILTFTPLATATQTAITSSPTASYVSPVVFAVIGDYGTGHRDEGKVADLVLSWQPDFIITVGDNNYPDGASSTIDQAVGQFFQGFIYPYNGSYGAGADVNRFFPTLGNHDWYTDNAQPYLDYFSLPGNERYYDFICGPVHLFALDNFELEPDGVGASSKQAEWLKAGLAASTSAWNIVYMHYPPYSSGMHGSMDWARWPYKEWGADVVLAAHDHTYERLVEGGLTYFVNGLGSGGRYDFKEVLEGSQARYNAQYGAQRVQATEASLKFEFINVNGELIDEYEIQR